MKKKRTTMVAVIAVILLAVVGVAFALTSNQSDKPGDGAMMKNDGDAMIKDDAMNKGGAYITLEDYNQAKTKYTDSTKVYFFHAGWCPICQGINKEIEADMSKIPAGVVLIKTDFDKETELRKKYGVTYQYTFVQFDNDGKQIKKWTATNLSDAVNGIQR